MRAAFIERPFSMAFINDAHEPEICKEDEVKIHVHTVGICGSELHAYRGVHPFRIPPVISGHEFSGTVVGVGRGVTKYQLGDRVTAEIGQGCGRCSLCEEGLYNVCNEKRYLGAGDWSGPFGEFVVIPENLIYKLPDNISFEVGALIEPLSVGMHAVRTSRLKLGDTVCVVGCGTIGLSIILAARLAGASMIIASSTSEANLQLASEMGATHLNLSLENDLCKKTMDLTENIGVDTTFLAFGNEKVYDDALSITRPRGVVSQIAFMNHPFVVDVAKIQRKALHIMGCNAYVSKDYNIVCEVLKNERFPSVEKMISKIFPIEECTKAMQLVDERVSPIFRVMLQYR